MAKKDKHTKGRMSYTSDEGLEKVPFSKLTKEQQALVRKVRRSK